MNILEEAGSLVDGPREQEYGHPIDDFTAVSGAAKAIGLVHGDPLHHALYMVLVKVRRLIETPGHRDSMVDGPGYFRTYEKVWNRLNGVVEKGPAAKLMDKISSGRYEYVSARRSEPEELRLHPASVHLLEREYLKPTQFITYEQPRVGTDDDFHYMDHEVRTIMGIPTVLDESVPEGVIELWRKEITL